MAPKPASLAVCVRVASAALLRKLFESIGDLATDVNLEFSAGGMSVSAMDSSHVCLFEFLLPPGQAEKYTVAHNQSVGVNVHNLLKVFRCAGSNDSVELRVPETAASDEIEVLFESPSEDKSSSFVLKLMDLDVERLETPDVQYEAVVTMGSVELQRIFRNLSSIGDTVDISASGGRVEFSTNGDLGRARVALVDSETDEGKAVTEIRCEGSVGNTFALRYMNSFTKATPLSTNVKISMIKDQPVRVQYSLDDGDGFVRFYLAPKISDEDMTE